MFFACQLQYSFKHNAKKHLIFAAIFLSSFVSRERLILYMQLVENFKCFQPPVSIGADQQRQHSILLVFWWWGSYWLQLYNKNTCHNLKSKLCSKFIRQILGGITLVVYFVQVKQIFLLYLQHWFCMFIQYAKMPGSNCTTVATGFIQVSSISSSCGYYYYYYFPLTLYYVLDKCTHKQDYYF